jgi:hypothetical protein
MAALVELRSDSGAPLNARVEIDSRGVVLHSRSGADRNRDYRLALETLLTRLDAAAVLYDIYLDSAPVQKLPLDQRKLAFPRGLPVPERFNAIVRAMNVGSSSNGAWRRILIRSLHGDTTALVDAVRGAREAAGDAEGTRLPATQLRQVTSEDIDRAIEFLGNGGDASNFAPSRDFDLLTTHGARLAPKKVFGLALEYALGIEARPEHFSAGLGTPCFQMLEAAGYPIVRKDEAVPGQGAEPVDPDTALAEGRPKLVAHLQRERKPALAAAKRRAMIEQLGYLKCERCDLVPSQALGQFGDAVIEVHHAAKQVAEMPDDHITRLADLVCLCANCHRIVHRELAA